MKTDDIKVKRKGDRYVILKGRLETREFPVEIYVKGRGVVYIKTITVWGYRNFGEFVLTARSSEHIEQVRHNYMRSMTRTKPIKHP